MNNHIEQLKIPHYFTGINQSGVPNQHLEAPDLNQSIGANSRPEFISDYGVSLIYGRDGVQVDHIKGLELCVQAAESKNEHALINLGIIHFNEELSIYNPTEGIRILQSVNSPRAYFELGEVYILGLAGAVDVEKSLASFEIASSQKYGPALNALGNLHVSGRFIPTDYDTAFNFYSDAFASGYIPAAVNLGMMYAQGMGREVDTTKAKQQYVLASDLGLSDGSMQLALGYLNGIFVEGKNFIEAEKWFKKAADQGAPKAIGNLGFMYLFGEIGGTPNYQEAHRQFERLVKLGDPFGYWGMGKSLLSDLSTENRIERAKEYFAKGCALGVAECFTGLGECFEAQRNYNSALDCYHKAAQLGDRTAKNKYDVLFQTVLTINQSIWGG